MFHLKNLVKPLVRFGLKFKPAPLMYYQPLWFSQTNKQKIEFGQPDPKNEDAKETFINKVQTALMKYSEGNLDVSLKEFEDAFKLHSQTWAPTADLVEILIYEQIIHARKGNFSEALDVMKKAEAIIPRIPGNPHDLYLKTKLLIGQGYLRMKNIQQAYNELNEGLKSLEQSSTKDFRYKAKYFFSILDCYHKAGRYDEAISWGQKVLPEMENNQADPISRAEIFHALGHCYFQKRNYPKALENYFEAIKLVGEDSPLSSITLLGIASTYHTQGKLKDAESYFEKAERTGEKFLKKTDFQLAAIYNEIGQFKRTMKKYSEVVDYYKKALNIVSGSGTTEEACALNNIASILLDQRNYMEAKGYVERSLELSLKSKGEPNLELISIYSNLGSVYQYMNDFKTAVIYYQKGLENCEQLFGSNHPEAFSLSRNIGITYQYAGDLENAKKYLLQALKVAELNSINDIYHLMDIYGCLTRLYYDQKNPDEGMKCCLKASEFANKIGQETFIKNFEMFKTLLEKQQAELKQN